MKKLIISTTLFFTTFYASGQSNSVKEPFTKINIQGDAKVILRQDSVCSVRYTGSDDPSDDLTSIRNGTLIIGGNPNNELNISMASLEQIKIQGRGAVTGISHLHLK